MRLLETLVPDLDLRTASSSIRLSYSQPAAEFLNSVVLSHRRSLNLPVLPRPASPLDVEIPLGPSLDFFHVR